jgi:hypothetical protein
MRDRFGIFGAVIRIRKLSLLLVMTLRMPNNYQALIFGCVLLLSHHIIRFLGMSRSNLLVARLLIHILERKVSIQLLCLLECRTPILLWVILQSIWSHNLLVLHIIVVSIQLV